MLCQEQMLVDMVKTNMEESANCFGGENVTIVDNIGVEHYIKSKLSEALLSVFFSAPAYMLEQVDATELLIPKPHQNGSGELELPDDILKMTLFKMHGWQRGVTQFYDNSSPLADLQKNPYAMGRTAKPVVIISPGEGSKKTLYYYSLPAEMRNHEVEKALYVKIPNLSEPLQINDLLVPSVTYLVAAMVYDITGEPDRAALMRSYVTVR